MFSNAHEDGRQTECAIQHTRASAHASRIADVMAASFAAPAPYRSLHAYLNGRYADSVVLTFAEIEDLLGFALPDQANVQEEWWANDNAEAGPSPQSRAWTLASRTATANLRARTVLFERVPG